MAAALVEEERVHVVVCLEDLALKVLWAGAGWGCVCVCEVGETVRNDG